MLDHALQFLPAQGSELMHEADPRVQLRVASQSFLKAGHANQHHAYLSTIVEVAQLLETGVLSRSASSTTSKSGGWLITVAFGSPYHVARAPRPSTVPHRLRTA